MKNINPQIQETQNPKQDKHKNPTPGHAAVKLLKTGKKEHPGSQGLPGPPGLKTHGEFKTNLRPRKNESAITALLNVHH